MSYDIFLKDLETDEYCKLKELNTLKSGTYQLGGSYLAKFNITYNYSKLFCELFGEKGIRIIYGLTGSQSIPLLTEAILKLQDNEDPCTFNYWAINEWNAKVALEGLLYLANQCPKAVWVGD